MVKKIETLLLSLSLSFFFDFLIVFEIDFKNKTTKKKTMMIIKTITTKNLSIYPKIYIVYIF